MAMKNRYANRSRISEAKFRQLVRLFALDLQATQIAILTGLNRKIINQPVFAWHPSVHGRIL